MPAAEVTHKLKFDGELSEMVSQIAREQGEDPDRTCALIQELRDLIFEKGGCNPHRTDDEFLIKFLRSRFWKVDKAYNLLCNYYAFREANRELYEKVHPKDLLVIGDDEILEVTPYKDQNERRMIINRIGNWNPSRISVDDMFRAILLMVEIGSLEPVAQIVGGVGIFDMSNLSISQVFHLTPSIAQKVIALMVTSMPVRTSAIHVVNQNWVFNAVFQMFKPFLNARMKEKIFIHGSNMASLHEHIHPDHLPQRYGGVHPDYPYNDWLEGLGKCDKISKELEQLGYVLEPREGTENETNNETND